MNQYGSILRTVRAHCGLSLKQAASMIERSVGWLCEVEAGKPSSKCSKEEFERIIACYGVEFDARACGYMFWTHQTQSPEGNSFDGAILKYLRTKSGSSLKAAAQQKWLIRRLPFQAGKWLKTPFQKVAGSVSYFLWLQALIF